jgi:hypothetical protein
MLRNKTNAGCITPSSQPALIPSGRSGDAHDCRFLEFNRRAPNERILGLAFGHEFTKRFEGLRKFTMTSFSVEHCVPLTLILADVTNSITAFCSYLWRAGALESSAANQRPALLYWLLRIAGPVDPRPKEKASPFYDPHGQPIKGNWRPVLDSRFVKRQYGLTGARSGSRGCGVVLGHSSEHGRVISSRVPKPYVGFSGTWVLLGVAPAVFAAGVGPMTTDASVPFRMSTSTPVA